MAFFFGDGFDCYRDILDCGSYWDAAFGAGVTLALSASGRFAGTRGAVNIGSSTTPYLTKTSSVNDAVHHISVAAQQTVALTGTSAAMFFTLFDGATAQCSVVFRSDGALLLTSGNPLGATLATYTSAIAAINTWYQYEIEVVINNTTGSISVRRNGNTSNDFTATGLNTRASANNYANKIGFGSVWASVGAQVCDDFLWRSDASSVPWIGDVRCYTRMPAADSAVQFTRSGSVVPVTPFVQGSTVAVSNSSQRYTSFIATCDGAIGSAVASMATGYTGNMKCSLFTNSGSNTPGTVLGSATSISNPATGNNTFTFGTPVAVTRATSYWVGFASDVSSGTHNSTASVGFAGAYANSGVSGNGSVSYAGFPTANASITAAVTPVICTLNITPTTAANANLVAEVVQDAAAGYVFDATVGDQDLYTLQAISGTPSSIVAVTTRAYAQKSDAGTRNIGVQLKSGATTSSGASSALNTTFSWVYRTDTVDPNTSAAWDATGVNNLAVGVKVTA